VLLVIDPSCADYAGTNCSVIRSQPTILRSFSSGNCLTGKFLGHVLVVLVAVAVGSDQSTGLGITYESARISEPLQASKTLRQSIIPMYCENQTSFLLVFDPCHPVRVLNSAVFNHTIIWLRYSCGNVSVCKLSRKEMAVDEP
jgi:hypothetical protein